MIIKTNKTLIAAIVFRLATAIFLITIFLSYYLALRLENERFLRVPSGALKPIITQLGNDGVDLGTIDLWLIRFLGVFLGAPKYGLIDIGDANTTRLDLYLALIHGKSAFDEITLIPGETTLVSIDAIAQKLVLNADKMRTIYYEKAPFDEGVLIPETYQIIKGSSEREAMISLIERSMKIHKDRAIKQFGVYDEREWFRIVTIASIVQKEAASNSEMPLVASVIYNRLKKNMRLQMDGTLNYGYFSHKKVTPERIKSDTSDFNTYKKRGLPPYPVALAGSEAIEAALNPAKSDYLYFVRGDDGQHDFSENYREHLGNIHGKK
ncbi:aminodeoxychorismate lyase [Campylobacterota bacterium]|nr:aminodeoxychorismate lyase [Campylobacterota bacterium]